MVHLKAFPGQMGVDSAVTIAHPRKRYILDTLLEDNLINFSRAVVKGSPVNQKGRTHFANTNAIAKAHLFNMNLLLTRF